MLELIGLLAFALSEAGVITVTYYALKVRRWFE